MQAFDFTKDYILENEAVRLCPLQMSDYEHLLPFSLQEPEIWKYSSQNAHGEENLRQYIQTAVDARTAEKEYTFIVFDKKQNSYAGSTRFYDIQLSNQMWQLGFTWYGSAFQGTGLNKHCKYLLLQFSFDTMGMERVEFRADNLNSRSIAAMKSIGCVPEGVLRSHALKRDGTRRDSIILSILKSEWENSVREMLLRKLT
jgi:N-acetyltransferase